MKKIVLLYLLLFGTITAYAQIGTLECDGEMMDYNINGIFLLDDDPPAKVPLGVLKHMSSEVKANNHIWVTVNNKNKPKQDIKKIETIVEFFKKAENGKFPHARPTIHQVEENVRRHSVDFYVPADCVYGEITINYYTRKGNFIIVTEEFKVEGAVAPPKTTTKKKTAGCSICKAEESKYNFTFLKGNVQKKCSKDNDRHSTSLKTAKKTDQIFYDDLIMTGVSSQAELSDKTNKYVVKEKSSVLVNRNIGEGIVGSLKLNSGKMWTKVKGLAKREKVEVRMVECLTDINGTVVAFEESANGSQVWLFAGDVDVKSNKTGKKQALKAGQRSVVGKNGSIEVKSFNIEDGAKRFGIDMNEIKDHYSNTSNQQPQAAATPQGPYARYGVKSGIVRRVVSTGTNRTYTTTWFDDYGRLERREDTKKETKVGGKWKETVNYVFVQLYIDDKYYRLDPDHKSVSKKTNTEINFSDPKSSWMNRYQMRKTGKAKVKGYDCDTYSGVWRKFSGDVKVEFYVWKGIVIKQVEHATDGVTTTEIESIEFPSTMDASLFKIPSNYK